MNLFKKIFPFLFKSGQTQYVNKIYFVDIRDVRPPRDYYNLRSLRSEEIERELNGGMTYTPLTVREVYGKYYMTDPSEMDLFKALEEYTREVKVLIKEKQ